MSFYAGYAINSLIFTLIYVATFYFCISGAAHTSKNAAIQDTTDASFSTFVKKKKKKKERD